MDSEDRISEANLKDAQRMSEANPSHKISYVFRAYINLTDLKRNLGPKEDSEWLDHMLYNLAFQLGLSMGALHKSMENLNE